MGLVYAEIELINWEDMTLSNNGYLPKEDVKRVKVEAMVDSGAYMMVINENIKNQLGLNVVDKAPATLANGVEIMLEVVGPLEIRFANRRAFVEAMVLPGNNEILLGAIPMEQMDVLIDPKKQQLIVNPLHPFKPGFVLK